MKWPPSLLSEADSLLSGLGLVLGSFESKMSTFYGVEVPCETRATAKDGIGSREG